MAREVLGTKVTVAGGQLGTARADLRHAGLFGSGRFGYRVSGGFSRSDTWNRARTNVGDLGREYANAVDTIAYPVHAPIPGFDLIPLNGQQRQSPLGVPGEAVGDRDASVISTRPQGSIVTRITDLSSQSKAEARVHRTKPSSSVADGCKSRSLGARGPGWRGTRPGSTRLRTTPVESHMIR